ncbi:DUF1002 domain-containing protein [Carnobacterium divergens]|uniref:DUF1002 domain-containing protein n=1 Tax=Carnobacterium divergens TaxID=2748 RepID=A0A2R8A4U6_CARDV|nr:DUF1002 domain-containing protein [Carnobacterium divergens]MCO6018976.1 DUF1002 domain-containing protein [Carnobacterium divergens]TFI63716.1 hypothetical protein CKN62_02940 [Carnobacterium divergens]TFI74194.1 hypothetical protein CKN58_02945 [Carnobacterium divergens]TFI78516.1 hypothetical protein CKN85_02940 [Carnobacterium divergens]TFI85075.1 hypothetical protein CKN56_02915 [Carnobacterium divergens]
MKLKKILTASFVGLITLGGLASAHPVQARTSINETWGKPAFTRGVTLNQSQIAETRKLLGIQSDDAVDEFVVDGNVISKYLQNSNNPGAQVYSSSLIQRTSAGDGVKVEIVTPENITLITTEQYRNASITAGVTDATIKVASAVPVTGEGALAGVFMAFDENGQALDKESIAVGQEELGVISGISEANKDNADFSDANLNVAFAEIKAELAKIHEKQDQLATKEDVEKIVNEALKNNNLEKVVTPEQTTQITNFMIRFQNSPAINNKELISQLNNFGKDVMNNAKNWLGEARNSLNSEEAQNFLQKVSNSWDRFVSWVTGFFN